MTTSDRNSLRHSESDQDQIVASSQGIQLEIQRLYVKQQSAQTPHAPDIFQQAGIFFVRDCPADQRGALLEGYCPGILHPYARKVIADLVWSAGFLPIVLPPIDFEQVRQKFKREWKWFNLQS